MEKLIHSPTDINSALAAFVANRATSESPPSKSILSSKIQPGTPIARLRRKTHERSLSHGNGLKSCISQNTEENGIVQHSKSSSLGGVSVNSDSLGLKPKPPPRAKPRRSIQDVNKSSVDHTSSTSSYSEITSDLANLQLHMVSNNSPVPNKYIFPQSHTFLNASSNNQLPNAHQKPNHKLLFNQLPHNTNFQHNLQQQNFQHHFHQNFQQQSVRPNFPQNNYNPQIQNNNNIPPQFFAQ